MDKETFLSDVMHEINALKQNATPEELAKLNIKTFDPMFATKCIYGQMTGMCDSPRAKELMDVACKRVMHLDSGVSEIKDRSIDLWIKQGKINGEYTGQTWSDPIFLSDRSYEYLSALEGYINAENANTAGIIAYLKGEAETVEL